MNKALEPFDNAVGELDENEVFKEDLKKLYEEQFVEISKSNQVCYHKIQMSGSGKVSISIWVHVQNN